MYNAGIMKLLTHKIWDFFLISVFISYLGGSQSLSMLMSNVPTDSRNLVTKWFKKRGTINMNCYASLHFASLA